MMTSKRLLYIVFFIFLFGTILALLVAYDIYGKNNFKFCVTEECFKYAYIKFKTSFDIIVSTGLIAAYVSALLGSYIGLRSYQLSIEQDRNNKHLVNLSDFRIQIKDLIDSNESINKSYFFINRLYCCIFPESYSAVFKVSENYKIIIEDINKLVCESNASCGTGAGWTAALHVEKMIINFNKIGIEVDVDVSSPDYFFPLEGKVFDFIDQVNTKVLDFDYKLSDLIRSYDRVKK